MYPFEFCLSTDIIFGEGEVAKVGSSAAGFGQKALLLTYDEKFVKEIGFYEKVEKSCREAGVELVSCFGVKSNPTISHAKLVLETVEKEKPDVLIALGGGSVIDETKLVSAAAKYDGDPIDLLYQKAPVTATLPIVAVLTIPATSSELNMVAIITDDKTKRKEALLSPLIRPKVTILDPELTYSIPLKQTAYSAADIISHLMEGCFSHKLEWAPFQDRYCYASMRTIIDCMDRILENPADKEARAQFMWTASYAWSGFYQNGLGPCEMTIHMLGHSLSNFYDTPHGAAMSVTILATMKYFLESKAKRFARFAREVLGVSEADDKKAAAMGIDILEKWFKKIGTPTNFAEAGIPADAIDKLAVDAQESAVSFGQGDAFDIEKIRALYSLCI